MSPVPLPTFEKAKAIKLIALDLDGTSLRHDRTLHPATIEAVSRARAAGIDVVLASGRTWPSVRPFSQKMELPGFAVCANGAHVTGPEGTLETTSLAVGPRETIIELAHKFGLHVNAYTEDELLFISDSEWGDLYKSRLRSMTPRITSIAEILSATVLKIMTVTEPGQVPQLREALTELLDPAEARIVESEPEYVELLNPDANKGKGLRRIAAEFNVSSSEVAAIGDYLNDLEMVRWAGFSGAVANAHEDLKASADYLVNSNDEGGVAQFIDSILQSKRE